MNKNLHVYSKIEEIISAVENFDTVILTAETGSGKSTQVPQMLYENGYDVIVTQPRRIACISLADRVSEEMGDLSYVVGYHTAFESNRTEDTKILFCTDGLQMAKGIRNVDNTILVLDEVHEWNLNIETLVAWIKKFRSEGNKLKVVLMSATIELEDLANFYGEAKCISIPGRNYDVEKIHKGSDYILETIISYIDQGKNILVFMEGKKEIDGIISDLMKEEVDAEILPLHGELPSSEQRLCLNHYDRPKVVVSTNIAQTSVTISDIDVVIDNGKEKRIEVNDGIEGLFVHDISKADCLQRAGRAGRTKNGIYVLCSENSLDEREEYSTPEIQRLVLDKVVLKLMSVGINPLNLEFFHQPSIESLTDSMETLKMLGAIENNKVTKLGMRMIKIPVSVRYARMIIEAEKYECTEQLIKAVSIMETGSLIDFRAKKEGIFGGEMKLEYSDFVKEDRSDILAEIGIYNNIIEYKYDNLAKSSINVKTFRRVKEFIAKLEDSIYDEVELTDGIPSKIDFVKCIFAGIPDRLFKNSYYRNDYEDVNGRGYKLKDGSCCTYGYNFVLAIPKTITFKNKWGWDDTLDILTMATGIKESEFESIAPDMVSIIPAEDASISYNANHNCFIQKYKSTISGFELREWYDTIREDDPRFEQLKSSHADLIEIENSKRVIIGKNVYEIQFDYWDRTPYITIYDENDIMSSDIKTLKDANGKPVKFRTHMRENYNLDILRQFIMKDRERDQIERVLAELPKGKTGSTKIIIDEFLGKLGKADCSIPELGVELFKYVGLDLDKESATFKIFDSESEAEESTNDTLKFLVKKAITQNYGDKKFFIRSNGKKIETKKTEAAKQDFHEYCQEIIKDTTASNFAEQLEFLDEIFNECIESFQ